MELTSYHLHDSPVPWAVITEPCETADDDKQVRLYLTMAGPFPFDVLAEILLFVEDPVSVIAASRVCHFWLSVSNVMPHWAVLASRNDIALSADPTRRALVADFRCAWKERQSLKVVNARQVYSANAPERHFLAELVTFIVLAGMCVLFGFAVATSTEWPTVTEYSSADDEPFAGFRLGTEFPTLCAGYYRDDGSLSHRVCDALGNFETFPNATRFRGFVANRFVDLDSPDFSWLCGPKSARTEALQRAGRTELAGFVLFIASASCLRCNDVYEARFLGSVVVLHGARWANYSPFVRSPLPCPRSIGARVHDAVP